MTTPACRFPPAIAERLERLHGLADDPAAFATLRREIIEAQIRAVPAQRRAMVVALQAGIDAERAVGATPVRALRCIVQAMLDRVEALAALAQRAERDG
ncbi:MAG: DUF3135 domain-containing protein [Rhodocyclaceae bacterium]